MKILKRAAALISAGAMAVTLAVPLSAAAEDSGYCSVTFNYDGFDNRLPVTVETEEGTPLYLELSNSIYNQRCSVVTNPSPVNGKAITGWAKDKAGNEVISIYDQVFESMELYPVLSDSYSLGTVELSLDESYLPSAGSPIPSDLTDLISVPADAPYYVRTASYKTGSTYFADNTEYIITAYLRRKDGKAFNYTYNKDYTPVLDIDGAAFNGTAANVNWAPEIYPYEFSVSTSFKLGTPETCTVNIHYNGIGGAEDVTVTVPKGRTLGYFLDNSKQQIYPYDENGDYVLNGWYFNSGHTSYANDDLDDVYVLSDFDLYANWQKVIKEVNITIEVPECGTEVDYDADVASYEGELNYNTTVDGASVETNTEIPELGGYLTLKNQPVVTCDVPGLELEGVWIETDLEPDELDAASIVRYFHGTIHGENDYMFLITPKQLEDEDPPVFSPDLKITVNGIEVPERDGWLHAYADAKKPSAGGVSKLTTISKNGNDFVVVGMITAEHIWQAGVITTIAGCETKGIMTYTCKSNDASYTEEFDASGHKWGPWQVLKEATATEDGLEIRYCENDGEHKETRVIPKTGGSPTPSDGDTPSPATGSGSVIAVEAAVILLGAALVVNKKRK